MSDSTDHDLPNSDHLIEDEAFKGMVQDLGVPGEFREEMFENARLYTEFDPQNINDDPGFDDGLPGSLSDFDIMQDGSNAPRRADPNHDSGIIDGGPLRDHPREDSEE